MDALFLLKEAGIIFPVEEYCVGRVFLKKLNRELEQPFLVISLLYYEITQVQVQSVLKLRLLILPRSPSTLAAWGPDGLMAE